MKPFENDFTSEIIKPQGSSLNFVSRLGGRAGVRDCFLSKFFLRLGGSVVVETEVTEG